MTQSVSIVHIASQTTSSSLSEFTDDQVQPNAIDLRVAKIFEMKQETFVIDEDKKVHRGATEIKPNGDGY